MSLLEYENQIFLDGYHEDGLTVLAKGLGVDRIFLNFLNAYSDEANLVLVIGTSSTEEEYFLEQLENDNVKPLPKVITNEISATDRQNVYMQGGVLFITSRILVVDLLTDRVPLDHVTGILVYKAHRIVESGQEAFILRLFRQKNKNGFIKAFTDNACAFTVGFAHVERTMKNLFVRKLFLWPRFHASVASSLEKHKVDVVEIHVQVTSAMLACQTALLDLINACIQELKRCTTAIDADEITVENSIGKAFDTIIRMQLDPIWHQIGPKTRQLVSDLKTLRLILRHLTQYDCVTFYSMVNSVRSSEKTFGQNTGWLFLEAADSLFMHARERIYGPPAKKTKEGSETKADPEPVFELCPKWKVLSDVLKEIREDNSKQPADQDPGRVLIAAEDDRTCSQLREYLCEGGQSMLVRLFNKSVAFRGQQLEDVSKKAKFDRFAKARGKKEEKAKSSSSDTGLTLTQMLHKEDMDIDLDADNNPPGPACTSQDAYYGLMKEPVTVIHPLHGGSDHKGLTRTLQEIQPRYVILYDADMQFVRELEVFRASQPGVPLRVYFLMYTGSVEEQRYLTTLRKEKEAFEFLIKEKASMVIPEEQDGKLEDDPNLSRDTTPANATVNTRKGGSQPSSVQQKVIVDMREFRSELPSLIHRRGIDIEPVTLVVGDYILTPDICVERKSVSDLIGSLNSGRLFNQCVSMCRHYKRPVLLIEFDANKSFSLQGKYQISNDVSLQDTISRLALLTLHFSKLRILWCQSPYATAEIFEELKMRRPQPDSATAMAIGSTEDGEQWSDLYSHAPQDFLLRLPGVNVKNYRLIMKKVHNLAELSTLSEETLTEIMGNSSNAKTLHKFLHSEHKKGEMSEKLNKPAKTDYRRGFKRKK
ncbi:DNA repair endonuclease XPF-like [Pecten maximus]|uniref:DNA repair endonuclease XPF-like n=1 Tax=Pecten maximus TaxID=6579 RepID=UPI0014581828|nr:DNA repair endonuclease XPF-like [Pecten maximus]